MRIALIALAASAALAAPAFAQPYQDRPDPDQGYQGQTPPDQTDQDDNAQDQGPGYQGGPGDQGPQDRGYQGGPGNQGYNDRGYQGPNDQGYQSQQPPRVERRLAFVRRRIDHEIQIGGLSDDQAARLRSEFRQIDSLDRRYVAEGMTTDKNTDVNSRVDLLDSRVNYFVSMSHDHDSYGAYDR